MKKLHKIIVIFLTIVILIIISIAVVFSYFTKKINKNPKYIIDTIKSSYQKKDNLPEKQNFIILGLDPRNDELEKTEVTDTVIFVSLDTKTAEFTLISLPRDLWDYKNNNKINNIYQNSQDQEDSFAYIKENYSRLTGQSIDKVIIITTQNLIDFVDIIGGVNLYLENGFIDKEFPNEKYIATSLSDIPIYKTVEFPSGLTYLDSSNITEFVRSRKGSNDIKTGGTDLARIQRQQLLIEAIINKIKSKDFIKKPSNLTNLYNFWHQDIKHNLNDSFLLSLILKMGDNLKQVSLHKIDIPIGKNNQDGVIYHPKTFINRQWVFIPNDKEYQSLINFIKNSIN